MLFARKYQDNFTVNNIGLMPTDALFFNDKALLMHRMHNAQSHSYTYRQLLL